MFNKIDIITGKVESSHEGEGFKKPYVEDDNLHWFGYATEQLLTHYGSNLGKIIKGYFDEWIEKHKFMVKEAIIYRAFLENLATHEFQFVAPILIEGELDE